MNILQDDLWLTVLTVNDPTGLVTAIGQNQFITMQNRRMMTSIVRYDRRRVPFSATIDQLPKFPGEDITQTIESWISQVDDESVVYDWTLEKKFLAAKRALTSKRQSVG